VSPLLDVTPFGEGRTRFGRSDPSYPNRSWMVMIRGGVYRVPLMMLRELGCQPLCGRGRKFVRGSCGVCWGVRCVVRGCRRSRWGVQGFSLQYREVDLHLVEPGKLRHGETSSAVRTDRYQPRRPSSVCLVACGVGGEGRRAGEGVGADGGLSPAHTDQQVPAAACLLPGIDTSGGREWFNPNRLWTAPRLRAVILLRWRAGPCKPEGARPSRFRGNAGIRETNRAHCR
jgi:hypothetical protein